MSIDPLVKNCGLQHSSLTKGQSIVHLRSLISDTIKMIDAEIVTKNSQGFGFVEYSLPTTFTINNMNRGDVQIILYSEILRVFTLPESEGGKGFENVSLDISRDGNKAVLYVQWQNNLDALLMEKRRELITMHMIKHTD